MMKRCLMSLFFFLFLVFCNGQYDRSEMRDRKNAKKIAKESNLKCRFVFCGPVIDDSLKAKLKEEFDWLTFAEIDTRFFCTNGGCDYCDDLTKVLDNYNTPQLYCLNREDRQFICSSLDCQVFENSKDLQRTIIDDVLATRGKKTNDIIIIIPAKSQVELTQLLSEGWVLQKPSNENLYDKKSKSNCAGQVKVLYKKKSCINLDSFYLEWPNTGDYSKENGFKYIYAHKGRSNYFFFYTQRSCSDNLKLKFYREGRFVDSFDVNIYPMDSGELMYFEIMITRDNFDAPCFSDKCDDMELYELKICDEAAGECKSLGNYKFIHCSK